MLKINRQRRKGMNMATDNYTKIKAQVEAAAQNSPFHKDVTLLAVSKTHPVSDIMKIYEEGQRDFGENKPQELAMKYEQLPKDIRWHMIGHLQTNKIKYIIDKVCMIHSVDSVKLAHAIDIEAAKHGLIMPVLVEVNIADEPSKSGIKISETVDFLKEISMLENIKVQGLMCIPPVAENKDDNADFFRILRNLSIDIKALNIDNIEMNILSMGMSDDFESAIHEGADIVRIGTAIFGMRDYSNM